MRRSVVTKTAAIGSSSRRTATAAAWWRPRSSSGGSFCARSAVRRPAGGWVTEPCRTRITSCAPSGGVNGRWKSTRTRPSSWIRDNRATERSERHGDQPRGDQGAAGCLRPQRLAGDDGDGRRRPAARLARRDRAATAPVPRRLRPPQRPAPAPEQAPAGRRGRPPRAPAPHASRRAAAARHRRSSRRRSGCSGAPRRRELRRSSRSGGRVAAGETRRHRRGDEADEPRRRARSPAWSPRSCVENGASVEYGQTIVVIDPEG